jgi:LCP family protein required for cell wall assembly
VNLFYSFIDTLARHRRGIIVSGLVAVLVIVVGTLGVWGYVVTSLPSTSRPGAPTAPSVAPSFNVLIIGSDSRAGLSGKVAAATGAGSVSGQRSDVVKIAHIDPATRTISMISIPRDTMVSLLANQDLYTNYNRINVNYANGPSLLVRTIEANFGIVINHVVQVSFGGLINAAEAIGGVWLDFAYPAKDAYSGLNIKHAGCQLVDGTQALALARSRHYEYLQDGVWQYDGTSDYGRIDRQDVFLRALISSAERNYNPLTLNSFLSDLPRGIVLDDQWTLNGIISLALSFRHFNPASMQSYTLPTVSRGYVAPYGDVLFADVGADKTLLEQVFGSELTQPTNPPPTPGLVPAVLRYPKMSASTSVPRSARPQTTSTVEGQIDPTTTTTLNPAVDHPAAFDPRVCAPQ